MVVIFVAVAVDDGADDDDGGDEMEASEEDEDMVVGTGVSAILSLVSKQLTSNPVILALAHQGTRLVSSHLKPGISTTRSESRKTIVFALFFFLFFIFFYIICLYYYFRNNIYIFTRGLGLY